VVSSDTKDALLERLMMEEKIVDKKTSYSVMMSAIKKDFIPNEAELKTINSFMMCRVISNHPAYITLANFINNATDIPLVAQYWFVRSTNYNVRFIAPIKKTSEIDSDINVLADHYQCNYQLARQYYKLMPVDVRDKIIAKYKHIGRTKL
jgi:hypothetical protein